ncbi:MAG TPA: YhjD/YihY/BrkB family envelope integrity protein [Anaerolineae bacterium]|nr:YhjD/YihY/BrkB family envelope integrity protein [Anaerolineae bacterium]
MKPLVAFAKRVFTEWGEDKVPRLAAALSYYTVFSLAPLLVIAIAIGGLVFGTDVAEKQIIGQLQGLVGAQGAELVAGAVNQTLNKNADIIGLIFGIVTIVLGATGVVGELKDSLNTIWNVAPKPGQGLFKTVFERVISLGMVLGFGFLLLVSLVVSAALTGISGYIGGYVQDWKIVAQLLELVISFGGIALVFAILFKFLPDVKVTWRDVWIGALVTALLFTVGKFALGVYLGNSQIATPFGAAGSLVILLVWVYYAAQILFLGAEITQVYANLYGRGIQAAPDAVPLSDATRVAQGTLTPQPSAAISAQPSAATLAQPARAANVPPPSPAHYAFVPPFNPLRLLLGAIGVRIFSLISKLFAPFIPKSHRQPQNRIPSELASQK